jgi:Neuralized
LLLSDGEQVTPAGSHISVGNPPVNQDLAMDVPYYMLPPVCPAAAHRNPSFASNSAPTLPVPSAAFAHPAVDIVDPISFHQICGRNVQLSHDRNVATRIPDEYCNGYVFTHRPVRPGERLVVMVQAVEREYVGGLAFGVTSCDPSRLRASDLPDDADLLLDRPEYWVVHKDVCVKPDVGDELSFHLCTSGKWN